MFTWICPQCGREVPPAYNDCPDCSKKAAPAGGGAAAAGQPAGPPAQRTRRHRRSTATAAALLPAAAATAAAGVLSAAAAGRRRRSRTIHQQPQAPPPPAAAAAGYYAAPAARARNESAGLADDDPLRPGDRRRGVRHDLGWCPPIAVRPATVRRPSPAWRARRRSPAPRPTRCRSTSKSPACASCRTPRRRPMVKFVIINHSTGGHQRPGRQRHHLGAHPEIRGRRAGNVLLQHQSGAHRIQGNDRAAQHQAEDLRAGRLAEHHHRRADHRPAPAALRSQRIEQLRARLDRAATDVAASST